MKTLLTLVSCVFAVGLAGCGGGGSGGDDADANPQPEGGIVTQEIIADRAITGGWQRSTPIGGSGGGNFFVGDVGSEGTRGFLGFSIGGIPEDAEIVSAQMTIYHKIGPATGSPFTDLGNLIVDLVDYGPTLEQSDYDVPAVQPRFGILSDSPKDGVRSLDVTNQLRQTRALHVSTQAGIQTIQFRLRFDAETDNDIIQTDAVIVNGIDDAFEVGVIPTLTVEYRLP